MRARRWPAFTLAEVMVALLFTSIALFGYISLHLRLIHSGRRLEGKILKHEILDTQMAETCGGPIRGPVERTLVYSDQGNPEQGNVYKSIRPVDSSQYLYHVTWEVGWTDGYGSQRYVLDTYARASRPVW